MASLVAGAVAAGCSSSSGGSPGPEDGGTPDAACYVDASLAVFAGSDAAGAPCAACVAEMCFDAVHACANDCACINFFTCIADAGVATNGLSPEAIQTATTCAGSQAAALAMEPAVRGLISCLQNPCMGVCTPATDAGEGAPDAEPDAEPLLDAGPDGDAAPSKDAAGDQ